MRELILNMMSSKKLIKESFFALILCLVFMTPNLVEGKIFDRVVAKVNTEIITLSALELRAEMIKQRYRENDENQILLETLEMMIDEKLQVQQGKKMGFEVDDVTVDAAIKNIEKKNSLESGQLAIMLESEGKSMEAYKNNIRDQILVSKITKYELGGRVVIGKRATRKYYHDNQKEFWESGKIRVKHILILFEKGTSEKIRKKKYRKIKKILAELKAGKDFTEAAKEN